MSESDPSSEKSFHPKALQHPGGPGRYGVTYKEGPPGLSGKQPKPDTGIGFFDVLGAIGLALATGGLSVPGNILGFASTVGNIGTGKTRNRLRSLVGSGQPKIGETIAETRGRMKQETKDLTRKIGGPSTDISARPGRDPAHITKGALFHSVPGKREEDDELSKLLPRKKLGGTTTLGA